MKKEKCLKCKEEWIPRKEGLQVRCPRCGCRNWSTYEKEEKIKPGGK